MSDNACSELWEMTAGREKKKEEQPHSKLQLFGVFCMDNSGGE